ncbi:MAG: tetratricopeptide repeat protein [Planctomycetota bacterium]|nr:tetratricopeptide repeat protein [Planctomycetota bacterium]
MKRLAQRLAPLGLLVLLAGGCQEINWSWPTPDPAREHYQAGSALIKQGRLEAAKVELSEAIRANPNLPEAHACLGDIHRKQKQYARARDSYIQACQLDPYAFRPHYNLGVTYQLMAAQAVLADQASQLLRQAVQVYLRATTISPDDFESNLNLSACYHQLGRYEQAEQHCRKAIAIRPDSAAGWCNLGIICDAQGKSAEAIRAFSKSLEYDTNQPRILLSLGACHKRTTASNRLKAALHAFELALRIDPNFSEAYEQIGLIHFEVGDNAEALKAFERAIAIDPESSVAQRGKGAVLMLRYIADPTDARAREQGLACWTRSLEIDPDQPKLAELVEKYQAAPPAPAAPPALVAPVVPVVVHPASAPASAPAPIPTAPATGPAATRPR